MSGLSGLSNHCRERSFLIWAAVGFFPLAIGVSSPYPSFPRGGNLTQVSVMRALSPGIRIRGLARPGRFERDLELVAGGARVPLQRARRRLHAPALQARDHRARRLHSRRELLLRQTRARTRANHLACQLEFLVQVCHGLGIAGALLEPLLVQLINCVMSILCPLQGELDFAPRRLLRFLDEHAHRRRTRSDDPDRSHVPLALTQRSA